MTSVFSWQNSVSLCPASFCTTKPNLPINLGISWLPTFAFSSPMMKRTAFLVLVLEGLRILHRTLRLQFLQHFLVRAWTWIIVMLNCLPWKSEGESKVIQSCLTLWDPMDCSLPRSFVYGIFQARVLEWIAIALETNWNYFVHVWHCIQVYITFWTLLLTLRTTPCLLRDPCPQQ